MANETDTGSEPQFSGVCVAMETNGPSDSIVTVGSLTKSETYHVIMWNLPVRTPSIFRTLVLVPY